MQHKRNNSIREYKGWLGPNNNMLWLPIDYLASYLYNFGGNYQEHNFVNIAKKIRFQFLNSSLFHFITLDYTVISLHI